MNLPINRHKCLIALANDIIADGVDIDERIIITSSEQGCDNTKVLLVPDASYQSKKTQKAKRQNIMIVPINEFRENIERYK